MVKGDVTLTFAKIGGMVRFIRCSLHKGLTASGAEVDSDLLLEATHVLGKIEIITGSIGRLFFNCAIVPRDETWRDSSDWEYTRIGSFRGQNLNLRGDAGFRGMICDGDFFMAGCAVAGDIRFWKDDWRESFFWRFSKGLNPNVKWRREEPSSTRMLSSILGKLDLKGISAFSVDLSGLRVGGEISLADSIIKTNIRASSLWAESHTQIPPVLDHLPLRTTCGALNLTNAKCDGDADFSGLYLRRGGALSYQSFSSPFPGDQEHALLPIVLPKEGPGTIKVEWFRRNRDGGLTQRSDEVANVGWEVKKRRKTIYAIVNRREMKISRTRTNDIQEIIFCLTRKEETSLEPEVAARNFRVQGKLEFWRKDDSQNFSSFAFIEGPLDLTAAQAAHLVISGDGFDREAWSERVGNQSPEAAPRSWLSLQRANFGHLTVCEPFPFAIDFRQVRVGNWELRDAEGYPPPHDKGYETLLSRSYPFSKTIYMELVKVFRNRGDDRLALVIGDAMHDRDFDKRSEVDQALEACRGMKRLSKESRVAKADSLRTWVGGLIQAFLRPFQKSLHNLLKYGTHYFADTKPLVYLWVGLLLLSFLLFLPQGNIVAGDPFSTTPPPNWRWQKAAALALHYSAPQTQFMGDLKYFPGADRPLRWRFPSGKLVVVPWITPFGWANFMSVLNWLLLPAIVVGWINRLFRSSADH